MLEFLFFSLSDFPIAKYDYIILWMIAISAISQNCEKKAKKKTPVTKHLP
jgi:hypothetical protein